MVKKLVATYIIFFLFILSMGHHAFATVYPIPIDIVPDKSVYAPGDNVTLTINVPYLEGMTVDLSVTKGNTKQNIFQITRSLDGNSTSIQFILPEQDTFYQYLVYATVTSPNPNENYSTAAMLFTKEGAEKVMISDLSIGKTKINPGESIPISFKVKDGTGNVIPWADPDIGICKENAVKPKYVTVTPDSPLSKDSDCIFFQSDFTTDSGEFDIKLDIPDDMPKGRYQFNIWANPDYTGRYGFVMAHEVSDIVIGKSTDQSPTIVSPLKQFKSGISTNAIRCDGSLQLVIKSSNNHPACVTSETMQKLIERGWAKPV